MKCGAGASNGTQGHQQRDTEIGEIGVNSELNFNVSNSEKFYVKKVVLRKFNSAKFV